VRTTSIGDNVLGSNSRARMSYPCRDSVDVGSVVAPGISTERRSIGQASRRMRAIVPMRTGHGRRMTEVDQRRQKRPSRSGRQKMRSALTRGPSTPSRAGSSVRAESTEKNTTSDPPRPIERIDMYGMTMRPSRPTRTARPEKKIDRPAWRTVSSTASSTGRPAASSSRNLPTMKSE
jgi:hypothetical protein